MKMPVGAQFVQTFCVGIVLVCMVGCGDDKASVGGSCGSNSACVNGLTCNTQISGGYCTKPCATAGQLSECPAAAVCDVIEGKATQCVQICEHHEDCRTTLDCNGVAGTNIKACKPKDVVSDAGAVDAKKP